MTSGVILLARLLSVLLLLRISLTPFRPGRMALVCEGGGQRGIFTAGVLDEFMRAQFNPFHL
ncbi:hypothetical protein MJN76_33710, partial [Salmonella enterica subsp. enterica serovar Anatum]|nr:hypothetical protein [Salmonella enterica subsp. enterica serovar Anatum]